MEVGILGLGKMGFNLALNMKDHGHTVYAYDINSELRTQISSKGISTIENLEQFNSKFSGRKLIWLMIPAGEIVDKVIDELLPNLNSSDIIVDGGNSNFKDSTRRYNYLKSKSIDFLDCGTSGGMEGALKGVCIMIGGEKQVFDYVEPLFKSIAVKDGYLYTGKPGSGHYLKMVHNGIEYGMMQAIAEGFEVLDRSKYDYDYEKVAKVWNNGSVVRSWLMELTESAFSKDKRLENIKGIMHSSGEGKWTLETALDLGVPTPVIAISLMMRYRSQQTDTFSGKIVAALRNEFGGHTVAKVK